MRRRAGVSNSLLQAVNTRLGVERAWCRDKGGDLALRNKAEYPFAHRVSHLEQILADIRQAAIPTYIRSVGIVGHDWHSLTQRLLCGIVKGSGMNNGNGNTINVILDGPIESADHLINVPIR